MIKNIIGFVFLFFFIIKFSFSQDLNDDKEIIKRCKSSEKEGWKPDFEIGTCEYQINEIFKLQKENKIREDKGQEDKWIIETFDATSNGGEKTRGIAQDKARDDARNQLGKSLGSKFEGLIESGHHFITSNGEDITSELKEATGTFTEFFDKELTKNKLIARFEKQIRQGNELYWDIKVTIALDYDAFTEEAINKSTKKNFENKLTIENAFRKASELYKVGNENTINKNYIEAFKYFYECWLITNSVSSIKMSPCNSCDSISVYLSKTATIIKKYFSKIKIKPYPINYIPSGEKDNILDQFILPVSCTFDNSIIDFLKIAQKTDSKNKLYYPLNSKGNAEIYIDYNPQKEKEDITLNVVVNENIFSGDSDLIRINNKLEYQDYIECEIDFSNILHKTKPCIEIKKEIESPKTDTSSIILKIINCKTLNDLKNLYDITNETLFKLSVNSNEIGGNTEGCYIIVFENNESKNIKAILKPGKTRINLLSNKPDDIKNYTELPVMWLLIY